MEPETRLVARSGVKSQGDQLTKSAAPVDISTHEERKATPSL